MEGASMAPAPLLMDNSSPHKDAIHVEDQIPSTSTGLGLPEVRDIKDLEANTKSDGESDTRMAQLMCPLCRKTFHHVVVVDECGHAFCKACLEARLEKSRMCPHEKCSHDIPVNGYDYDRRLQRFVCKLRPREFFENMWQDAIRPTTYRRPPSEIIKMCSDVCMPDEKISFTLEYVDSGRKYPDDVVMEDGDKEEATNGETQKGKENRKAEENNKNPNARPDKSLCDVINGALDAEMKVYGREPSNDDEMITDEDMKEVNKSMFRRYFRCGADLPISILMELMSAKLGLDEKEYVVNVTYKGTRLEPDVNLCDIINIYGWNRNEIFRLYYTIVPYVEPPPDLEQAAPQQSAAPLPTEPSLSVPRTSVAGMGLSNNRVVHPGLVPMGPPGMMTPGAPIRPLPMGMGSTGSPNVLFTHAQQQGGSDVQMTQNGRVGNSKRSHPPSNEQEGAKRRRSDTDASPISSSVHSQPGSATATTTPPQMAQFQKLPDGRICFKGSPTTIQIVQTPNGPQAIMVPTMQMLQPQHQQQQFMQALQQYPTQVQLGMAQMSMAGGKPGGSVQVMTSPQGILTAVTQAQNTQGLAQMPIQPSQMTAGMSFMGQMGQNMIPHSMAQPFYVQQQQQQQQQQQRQQQQHHQQQRQQQQHQQQQQQHHQQHQQPHPQTKTSTSQHSSAMKNGPSPHVLAQLLSAPSASMSASAHAQAYALDLSSQRPPKKPRVHHPKPKPTASPVPTSSSATDNVHKPMPRPTPLPPTSNQSSMNFGDVLQTPFPIRTLTQPAHSLSNGTGCNQVSQQQQMTQGQMHGAPLRSATSMAGSSTMRLPRLPSPPTTKKETKDVKLEPMSTSQGAFPSTNTTATSSATTTTTSCAESKSSLLSPKLESIATTSSSNPETPAEQPAGSSAMKKSSTPVVAERQSSGSCNVKIETKPLAKNQSDTNPLKANIKINQLLVPSQKITKPMSNNGPKTPPGPPTTIASVSKNPPGPHTTVGSVSKNPPGPPTTIASVSKGSSGPPTTMHQLKYTPATHNKVAAHTMSQIKELLGKVANNNRQPSFPIAPTTAEQQESEQLSPPASVPSSERSVSPSASRSPVFTTGGESVDMIVKKTGMTMGKALLQSLRSDRQAKDAHSVVNGCVQSQKPMSQKLDESNMNCQSLSSTPG